MKNFNKATIFFSNKNFLDDKKFGFENAKIFIWSFIEKNAKRQQH